MEETVKEGHISLFAMIIWIIIDLLLCCILIGVVKLVVDLVKFATNKLEITTKNIHGRKGLINREELDAPLNKITGIKVEQGFFGQVFNYGTIKISTATASYAFEYFDHPQEFKAVLNQQIDKYEDDQAIRHAQRIAQAMNQQ